MGWQRTATAGVVALALCLACEKIPIRDIEASFPLADFAWFEEEETLFVFYRVTAEQGIGEDSVLELTYRTDDGEVPWTSLEGLEPYVHPHVPVQCGIREFCGSLSLHVPAMPRSLGLRLRYHRDGELFLFAQPRFNAIATGPAHTNRSLVVYGVFDKTNAQIQWRARHQFPTLRNEDAEALGLRRHFVVEDRFHGVVDPFIFGDNLYGYGLGPSCGGLAPLPAHRVETTDRAIFETVTLPLEAQPSSMVCAMSTVHDARTEFQTIALARKNPEVRPAFPLLRSPITENAQVQVLLRICGHSISPQHLAMQQQRLLFNGPTEVCIDDWNTTGFRGQLGQTLRSRIDAVRAQGQDMVLTIALHHDVSTGLHPILEGVLGDVLNLERDRLSPRVSGAFVFDSVGRNLTNPALKPLVLWCPGRSLIEDLDDIPDVFTAACPIQIAIPDLTVGPLRFNTLPILPNRTQYDNFVENYSEAQAGVMRRLWFLAPERSAISRNVSIGEFGYATFFNNELITADADDAFSVKRCEQMPTDFVDYPVVFTTDAIGLPLPVELLGPAHADIRATEYSLGLGWDYPFLMRMEYETFVAGAATAYSLTVPFGVGIMGEQHHGAIIWETGEFDISDRIRQCVRFCDHPAFRAGLIVDPDGDGPARPKPYDDPANAGEYGVQEIFRTTYATECYAPNFPEPGNGGFPIDP